MLWLKANELEPGLNQMSHDWIFDVLTDLQSYALRHDLPALAAQADLALRVARAEINAARTQEAGKSVNLAGDDEDHGTPPPPKPPHRH